MQRSKQVIMGLSGTVLPVSTTTGALKLCRVMFLHERAALLQHLNVKMVPAVMPAGPPGPAEQPVSGLAVPPR